MPSIQLSKELEEDIKEFPEIDWSKVAEEAIKATAFELKLSRSKELQKAVIDALASKSKLREEDTLKLGNIINKGLSNELKDKGLL